jgi:toxin secretion/phage lysis holin
MMKVIDLYRGLIEQIEPVKFKLPMIGAIIIAPIIEFFGKYVFADWEFLILLSVLVFLDTITGFVKAWKRGTVSSSGFTGVILKGFVYGVFVCVLHALQSFSDKELVIATFDWVGTLGYAAVVVRESISVIENLGAIKHDLIPSWVLKRLKDFDEDGKVNE